MEPIGTPIAEAPTVRVRRSTWSDLRAISRLYRARTETERRQFHPLPSGWIRLAAALLGVQAAQRFSDRWVRRRPGWAVVLVVAEGPADEGIAGFGAMRFRRSADGSLVALTGLLVRPERRRRHIASELKRQLLSIAAAAGADRAEALVLATNEASLALNRRFGYRFREEVFADPRLEGGRFLLAERELRPPAGGGAGGGPTPSPQSTGSPRAPSGGTSPPLSERSPA